MVFARTIEAAASLPTIPPWASTTAPSRKCSRHEPVGASERVVLFYSRGPGEIAAAEIVSLSLSMARSPST